MSSRLRYPIIVLFFLLAVTFGVKRRGTLKSRQLDSSSVEDELVGSSSFEPRGKHRRLRVGSADADAASATEHRPLTNNLKEDGVGGVFVGNRAKYCIRCPKNTRGARLRKGERHLGHMANGHKIFSETF